MVWLTITNQKLSNLFSIKYYYKETKKERKLTNVSKIVVKKGLCSTGKTSPLKK